MQSLRVADVMNDSVISVGDEAPLQEAVDLMQEHRISGLVVCDHAGYMVGVLSQTDLLRALQEGSDYEQLRNSPVSRYMTREVLSCSPEKPLSYAMQMLDQHQVRRLVVVESYDGGRFVSDRMKTVGILSQTDIVRALVGSAENTAEPVGNEQTAGG